MIAFTGYGDTASVVAESPTLEELIDRMETLGYSEIELQYDGLFFATGNAVERSRVQDGVDKHIRFSVVG